MLSTDYQVITIKYAQNYLRKEGAIIHKQKLKKNLSLKLKSKEFVLKLFTKLTFIEINFNIHETPASSGEFQLFTFSRLYHVRC